MNVDVDWLRLPEADAASSLWRDRWDELAVSLPQRLPMLSHAWVDAFAGAPGAGSTEVHCACAHRGDQLLGVLPLVVRRRGRAGWQIAFSATPYDEHTAFGDALLAAEAPSNVLPALLDAAQQRFGHGLAEVALRGVSAASATVSPASSAIRGWHCVRAWRGRGSYLQVASGTWDECRARLSKNFRQNLRKAHSRLRDDGHEARYEWLTGPAARPDQLGTFLALESSGWKGRAGTAVGQEPRRLAMYHRLVANLHHRGWLEWHLMHVDDRTIAAHLAVRVGTSLVVLKIAYDEVFARYSPGTLLFEKTVERAYADVDTEEVNCLTDMEWHKPWQMLSRDYFDCRYFPATIVGATTGWLPRVAFRALERLSAGTVGPP